MYSLIAGRAITNVQIGTNKKAKSLGVKTFPIAKLEDQLQ